MMRCTFCHRLISNCQTQTCEDCWNKFLMLQEWIDDNGPHVDRYVTAQQGELPLMEWPTNNSPDKQI